MQIDLLKERNRDWTRCADETVGDAVSAFYFIAPRRACCLNGFWSEMEEKSKGTCTSRTPRGKRRKPGKQEALQEGMQLTLQEELQQVQQVQQKLIRFMLF